MICASSVLTRFQERKNGLFVIANTLARAHFAAKWLPWTSQERVHRFPFHCITSVTG